MCCLRLFPAIFVVCICSSTECFGDNAFPARVQGFWRVVESVLIIDGRVAEHRDDADILIVERNKLIQISGTESGLRDAFDNQITLRSGDNDKLSGVIMLPKSDLNILGEKSDGHEEFPFDMKLSNEGSSASLCLTMRFRSQEITHKAVRLEPRIGVRELRKLLNSDMLCSPKLREILVQKVKAPSEQDTD